MADGGDSRPRRRARVRDDMLQVMETMVCVEKGLAKEPLKNQRGSGYGGSFNAHKRIWPGTDVWQPSEFKNYYGSVIDGRRWRVLGELKK